jgi:hypothetical protein
MDRDLGGAEVSERARIKFITEERATIADTYMKKACKMVVCLQ